MKVLIADDHPLVRDALARVLARLDGGLEVAEAADGHELIAKLEAQAFDLALVDLLMPAMDGAEEIRRLRLRWPALSLIVVSGQVDPGIVRTVLEAGAAGFVPKTGAADMLVEACRTVSAGGVYVPPHALLALRDADAPARRDVVLTPRQRDVLALLVQGEPNRRIAQRLGLTEGTVKLHIASLLRALRARNRTEAVFRARQSGLIGY